MLTGEKGDHNICRIHRKVLDKDGSYANVSFGLI